MAVVQLSTAPNRADYERVARIVNLAGDRPAGLILHAASELPTGEVQIVEVWDSAQSIAHFSENRILPAFTKAGTLDLALAGLDRRALTSSTSSAEG